MARSDSPLSRTKPNPTNERTVASQLAAVNHLLRLSAEVRAIIYTTNAVESLNMSLRKIIKTRGSSLNEEAALRLLYLAPRKHTNKWSFV